MLADVRQHEPASVVRRVELLDELDVSPRVAAQAERVVVTLTAHLRLPAVTRGELVPVLARDLARLAPDADGGVGEEAHSFCHQSFSTLQRNDFPSCIETFASPIHAVRSFTTSPVLNPAHPQCQGIPT